MIYNWDVPNMEGIAEGVVKGWMAEWHLPVAVGDTTILKMPMDKPKSWHAGAPYVSDAEEIKVLPSLDEITKQIHEALVKFPKAADKTEIDMEGFGKDGSRNRVVKEKQTHGWASFALPSEFQFITTHLCSAAKKGFVRMQETGV